MYDVAVLGSGPAGLGFATYAARQGLNVCCIDPIHEKEWHCTYCTWTDELKECWINELDGASETFDKQFEDTAVVYHDGSRQTLGKGYGRIDGVALKRMMKTACKKSERVEFIAGIVNQIDNLNKHSEVSYHSGGEGSSISARVIIDCSGHYSQFLDYTTAGSAAIPHAGGRRKWQSFHGELLELEKPHGYDLNQMVLFDWQNSHLTEKQKAEVPSFAYILPVINIAACGLAKTW